MNVCPLSKKVAWIWRSNFHTFSVLLYETPEKVCWCWVGRTNTKESEMLRSGASHQSMLAQLFIVTQHQDNQKASLDPDRVSSKGWRGIQTMVNGHLCDFEFHANGNGIPIWWIPGRLVTGVVRHKIRLTSRSGRTLKPYVESAIKPNSISDTNVLQEGMAIVHARRSPRARQILKMLTKFEIDVD